MMTHHPSCRNRMSASPTPNDNHLVWIDLEMTGLDPDTDSIIEIATLVTDQDLNILAEGPELAIGHPLARLQAMDDWNRNTHAKSGLWTRVLESQVSLAEAEARTLEFLGRWVPAGKSPICGNSICLDRRFLARLMPALERHFPYRNLDVSTLKELTRRWAPALLNGFSKAGSHTALSDIRESVQELAYYRKFMGRLGGQG
jgi:oligoribonuclease